MTRPRRPDPPPLETDDVRIAVVGTGAWAVALVALLLIGPPEADRWWLWVCVTGVVTGLFGVWYIPRLQRSRAELIAGHVRSEPAPPPRGSPGLRS
jgi:H+/Cl- antiporter ClcA